MTKKLFMVVILTCFLAISAWAMHPAFMAIIVQPSSSTVCTEDYVYETVVLLTGFYKMANSNSDEYKGFIYTPDSDESICEVDVYVYGIDGTLGASHDFYMRIYSMTGDNLNASLGQSGKLDGSDFSASTWISENAGRFVFSSPVSLSSGVPYAIVIFLDSDGNPNDTPPEVDSTNAFYWGYDDENDDDSIQGGRHSWDDDFTVDDSDDEDDMGVRIHRMM